MLFLISYLLCLWSFGVYLDNRSKLLHFSQQKLLAGEEQPVDHRHYQQREDRGREDAEDDRPG